MIPGTCTQTLRDGAVFRRPSLPVAPLWLWNLHADTLKVREEKTPNKNHHCRRQHTQDLTEAEQLQIHCSPTDLLKIEQAHGSQLGHIF